MFGDSFVIFLDVSWVMFSPPVCARHDMSKWLLSWGVCFRSFHFPYRCMCLKQGWYAILWVVHTPVLWKCLPRQASGFAWIRCQSVVAWGSGCSVVPVFVLCICIHSSILRYLGMVVVKSPTTSGLGKQWGVDTALYRGGIGSFKRKSTEHLYYTVLPDVAGLRRSKSHLSRPFENINRPRRI